MTSDFLFRIEGGAPGGTLFDHSVVGWLDGMSKGNKHANQNHPTVLADTFGGAFKVGRYPSAAACPRSARDGSVGTHQPQHRDRDLQVDHDSKDVDQRRDERAGRHGRVEAQASYQQR